MVQIKTRVRDAWFLDYAHEISFSICFLLLFAPRPLALSRAESLIERPSLFARSRTHAHAPGTATCWCCCTMYHHGRYLSSDASHSLHVLGTTENTLPFTLRPPPATADETAATDVDTPPLVSSAPSHVLSPCCIARITFPLRSTGQGLVYTFKISRVSSRSSSHSFSSGVSSSSLCKKKKS